MASVDIFRIRPARLDKDRFMALAAHVGLRGELATSEEGMVLHQEGRALVYGAPGSRLGGVLFYTDQQQDLSPLPHRKPALPEAERWSRDFLDRFKLGLRSSKYGSAELSVAPRALEAHAAVEDGKRVQRIPYRAEVCADMKLNGQLLMGPRARQRLHFFDGARPASMLVATWEGLDPYETRRLLSADEVNASLVHRFQSRVGKRAPWKTISTRLAYWAGEHQGGADLLQPYYFIEIEQADPRAPNARRQGPRRLFQIAATATSGSPR